MEYLRFILSCFVSLLINNFKRKEGKTFKNILLIRLDHLGDMVLTFSALENIRNEYKDAYITMITGQWNVDLFINSPLVDKVLVYNSPTYSRDKKLVTSQSDRRKLFKELKRSKFDLIIGFRDDFYTIFYSLCIFPRLRVDRGTVRLKIKIIEILNFLSNKNTWILQHEIETNKKIISPLIKTYSPYGDYFKLSVNELLWLKEFLKNNSFKKEKYALIHPGASWKYKRWKTDNFILIGKFLYNEYGLKTIIIGSKDEIEIGDAIEKNNQHIFSNQIGKTSLRESIILIINSEIAICNDSSPMHIAAQARIPTIGLMGPGEIVKFSPQGQKVKFYHKKLECYPCKQVICKYPLNPCVDLITPDEVKEGIRSFFDNSNSDKTNNL
jgi:ADP-heptose:LPS heptosyltransferase